MQGEFVRFAFADKSPGIGSRHLLKAIPDHFAPGRRGQLRKFLQGIVGIHPVAGFQFYADEKNSFSPPVARLYKCFQFALFVCGSAYHTRPFKKALFIPYHGPISFNGNLH